MYGEAFVPQIVSRTQIVGATAEALSGVSRLDLARHKANMVWITPEGGDLRYLWDGTSPTTSDGHLLAEGTPLLIEGRKRILNFKMCGDGGATVTTKFTLDNISSAGGIQ